MATFRFAPSPNGRLHLGHAYSALLNAALAQRVGGRLLVRLEDIDLTRCTPALAEACLADLQWLGLRWEEPVRVQSRHMADYAAALAQLRGRGLLYPCFCSRRQVAQHSHGVDPDGAPLYAGTCAAIPAMEAAARIAAGVPHGWRLAMAKALQATPGPHGYTRFDARTMRETHASALPARWGDAILARKEFPTSYHLCVVVDDAMQGVSHVVRGADLEAATDLHILLQALLALPSPRYYHHPLLYDETGGKLAKSKASESLEALRARGVTAEELRTRLLTAF